MHNNKLDQILNQRAFQEASPNLNERILNSIETNNWYINILEIFRELRFSRPAYAFSFALAIGFVIGFNDGSLLTDNSIDLGEFLYNEGVIL